MIPILKLKKNSDRRIKNGHLWIFSNELQEVPKLEPGSLVQIASASGDDYGLAFYNFNSLIAARLIQSNTFDSELLDYRIKKARYFRERFFPDEKSYRLIYGESDLLPGLVIDKYENYFAVQVLSAGWESSIDLVVEVLLRIFPDTAGIIQKNNSHHREIESLTTDDEILFGNIPDEIIISESDLKVSVSLEKGQKTGYFFDQRENRKLIRRVAKSAKVLDCYSNSGAFALNAAKVGAKKVTAVDISAQAVQNIRRNAELNRFNIEAVQEDVYQFLKNSRQLWDLIILDPPAFTKSKKNIKAALNGYFMNNFLAIEHIHPDGFLATSSCSQHINEIDFLEIINTSAKKQGVNLKMLFRGLQSPDHPIHTSIPETQYLKFFIFQVIK